MINLYVQQVEYSEKKLDIFNSSTLEISTNANVLVILSFEVFLNVAIL